MHQGDAQTAPEIYAAHMNFGAEAWEDRARYHQWGFNVTLRGSCSYWNEADGDFPVLPGDIHFSRPYTNSSWRVGAIRSASPKRSKKQDRPEQSWETAYAVFHPRPHWLTWLDSWEYRGGFARLRFEGAAWEGISSAVLALTQTYSRGGPFRDEQSLALFEIVILKILAQNQTRISRDTRIQQAVELMQSRYNESLTIQEIGGAVGLSGSHFAYLFAAEMGETPGHHLEQIRLARASEMLRFNTLKIGEIALATGFSDPNYFAYRFRLNFGQTPSEYRAGSRS